MNSFSSQYSGPGLSFVTYGNTYILFYNGKVLITIGPHWPVLLVFNILILAIHLILFFGVLSAFPGLKYFTSISFTYLQLSFLYCALKNPGIVFPSMEIELGPGKSCPRCGAEKKGYHCNLCDICIEGHDHHCGFIGKCVGQGNLKSFYGLLFGVFLCSGIFVISLAWTTWKQKSGNDK